MIHILNDTSVAEKIFENWEETLIYSCLQKVMGSIYVTDEKEPKSAMAHVGCFVFFGGEPDRELVCHKPEGFSIMVPQNDSWAKLIEECYPEARRMTRYAIKKDTKFDEEKLQAMKRELPEGYQLMKIDGALYEKCLETPGMEDLVSSFGDKEQYRKLGRGMVILKENMIVSGASSYSSYLQGIEIEVDTLEAHRRKHLATVACAALILDCLKDGLYPSWDAQNKNSVRLAENLGYEYDHEYTAYEVI